MGLAPSLNTLDVLTAPEVIPVLFEPPLLALGLAGLPALRLVAELLVVTVAPVRFRVGAGLAPDAPHRPVREQLTHTVRQ